MITALHPTDLVLGAEHCWHALDFREAGVPYDRSVFAQGIAAHAVLEGLGTNPGVDPQQVAQAVVLRLAGQGRSWDGAPEPPLQVEAVLAGVALGLAEHAVNPVPQGARYEHGVAVDLDFKPVPYDNERAALRTILDLVERVEEEDEESASTVCVVTDYKSSWRDRENALDTLQRKAQACLSLACGLANGCDVLRLVVRNLRVGQSYQKDLVLAESDALLETWRTELLQARGASTLRAADGKRPASPGPRCVGCPYVLPCEARASLVHSDLLLMGPMELARLYGAKVAEVKELAGLLRAGLAKTEAVPVDGMAVGYVTQAKRALKDTAYATLWERWSEGGQRDARGLLKALDLSVGALERAAMILFGKGRGAAGPRREWVATVTETRRTAKFGIAKLGRVGHDAPAEEEEGEDDE